MSFISIISALLQIKNIVDIIYLIVNVILVTYFFTNFHKKDFIAKKSFLIVNSTFLVCLIVDFFFKLLFLYMFKKTDFLLFIHPINILLFSFIVINSFRIRKLKKIYENQSQENNNNDNAE